MSREKNTINIFIDNEKIELHQTKILVRELIVLAEETPEATTLALREKGEMKKYDNLDEEISLKNGMHFFIFNNDPTPVA